MTIRHLKIFVQVYRAQNMTHAAKVLHMTQPAVTRTIQEIERYYGVRLFERINKRLSATECGDLLYSQALHIVDAFDTMDQGLRNWESFGILRVGASTTLGSFLLPEFISRFQQQYPHIKIQVTISNGENLQKALIDNRLDIALIEGVINEADLLAQALGKDRLVLITPPRHPLLSMEKVQLKDLLAYPFLLRETGSAGRTFLNNFFAVHDMPVRPLWESASTQALIKAVGLGLGISFLPQQAVARDIADGLVCTRDIADADLTRQHYLVRHKNKYLTKSLQRFIALCQTEPKAFH